MNAGARRILDDVDPVGAFLEAHRGGRPIALATSGTTGRPREVVRTTASWVDSFDAVTDLAGWDCSARVWIPGPLTSTMNLFAAVHSRMVGAERVETLAAATHLQLTPTAARRLLDAAADLHDRTLVVAGDELDHGLRIRLETAGATVHHYYGAAERSFVAWGSDATDLQRFPGIEVELRPHEVADDATTPVIWARSPYLASRTEGAPGPLRQDASGFATVGDRGRWVDDRLRVIGRENVVVTGGATVLLADVESALRPLLQGEVAAIGLPHPTLGAVVAVVLTDPADTDRARSGSRSLGLSRPVRWFLRPELPLTPAGKLDRAALVRLIGGSA